MKRYEVKYRRPGVSGAISTTVSASSASQAREQVKSRFNGAVEIIAVVEK